MHPGTKSPASTPHCSHERASLDLVPWNPACSTQKFTKDEHHGTESDAGAPLVVAWYCSIRLVSRPSSMRRSSSLWANLTQPNSREPSGGISRAGARRGKVAMSVTSPSGSSTRSKVPRSARMIAITKFTCKRILKDKVQHESACRHSSSRPTALNLSKLRCVWARAAGSSPETNALILSAGSSNWKVSCCCSRSSARRASAPTLSVIPTKAPRTVPAL